MPLLRDAVLSKIGYRVKNKLGILMGADAWRVGMQLVDPFDTDDITARRCSRRVALGVDGE